MKKMNKKGFEMSWQLIVGAIIALVLLVLLIIIVVNGSKPGINVLVGLKETL